MLSQVLREACIEQRVSWWQAAALAAALAAATINFFQRPFAEKGGAHNPSRF
jgi:hypothetical protein